MIVAGQDPARHLASDFHGLGRVKPHEENSAYLECIHGTDAPEYCCSICRPCRLPLAALPNFEFFKFSKFRKVFNYSQWRLVVCPELMESYNRSSVDDAPPLPHCCGARRERLRLSPLLRGHPDRGALYLAGSEERSRREHGEQATRCCQHE